MASPTQWTCIWVNAGSWWWTGRPGVLPSMGSQRVRHNWVTELNWKRNELSSLENTWRRLKCILLSERSQSEKTSYCMLPTTWYSRKGTAMETRKGSVVSTGWGKKWWIAEHRIFRVVSDSIHDNIVVGIYHYNFVKIHGMCSTETWTLVWTMGWGWCCISVGSLAITHIPLSYRNLIMG